MAFGAPSLKGRALRYLSQREHSRAELTRKLRRFVAAAPAGSAPAGSAESGAPPDDAASDASTQARDLAVNAAARIAEALDELAAHGLQSDERAAASVLNTQAPRSGERRLKQCLQAKGLAPELVASTLAQARGNEFERALALWQRRFGTAPQDSAERARQMRFLQGRGFGFDIVARVLRIAGAGVDEDASSPVPAAAPSDGESASQPGRRVR